MGLRGGSGRHLAVATLTMEVSVWRSTLRSAGLSGQLGPRRCLQTRFQGEGDPKARDLVRAARVAAGHHLCQVLPFV